MLKLYAWDELGDSLEERDPDELRALNEEGGWEFHHALPNGVSVLSTDRHFALEVYASSKEEAHAKMMEFGTYQEYQKQEDEQ